MSKLTDFLAATKNEFAAIADDGIAAGDVSGLSDTGSYSLNALISGSIYGGIAEGKVTGLAAESSAGKTMLALSFLQNWQRENPEGLAMIFESESAISKQMLLDRGIDTSRVGVIPVVTIEEFRNTCIRVIDKYESTPEKKRKPMFFVLDSLGMLSTNKEITDATDGKDVRDMTRAGLVRSAFRVITLRLGRAGIPFIVTNHTYQNISAMYGGQVASGGGGFRYACSTIITMTRAQEKVGTDVRGIIVTCTTDKSRFTRERQKIKTRIQHQSGLDRYYGLTEIAVEAGLLKKVSTKLEWTDTGESMFEATINRNPEKYWTKERLDKVDAFCKTRFCYGDGESETVPDEDEVEE